MAIVFIGLGSNLDNPRAQLTQAIEALQQLPESVNPRVSSMYRSRPMGPQDQPDYVNAVMQLDTRLSPLELLDQLQSIEQQQGRVRGEVRWGPRTLDLDLLLYDQQVIDLPRLKIPHPGLHERSFVLYPLFEIAPALEIPGMGSLKSLLQHCENDLEVINNE